MATNPCKWYREDTVLNNLLLLMPDAKTMGEIKVAAEAQAEFKAPLRFSSSSSSSSTNSSQSAADGVNEDSVVIPDLNLNHFGKPQ